MIMKQLTRQDLYQFNADMDDIADLFLDVINGKNSAEEIKDIIDFALNKPIKEDE
jgi:hypothetical protein